MGLILKWREIREKMKHWLWEESQYAIREGDKGEKKEEETHPQILNEIIEHAEALWVLAVLNVDQGADLGCLKRDRVVNMKFVGGKMTEVLKIELKAGGQLGGEAMG